MKLLKNLLLLSTIVLGMSVATAMDCPGGTWVDGAKCSEMGLDSHAGICQRGDRFETRCDDRRGSRGQVQHIVCKGAKRCRTNHNDDYGLRKCQMWDYDYDMPCEWGYYNKDCRNGCGTHIRKPHPRYNNDDYSYSDSYDFFNSDY